MGVFNCNEVEIARSYQTNARLDRERLQIFIALRRTFPPEHYDFLFDHLAASFSQVGASMFGL